MKRLRSPAAAGGERDAQRTPVTFNRGALDEAASFGPVDEAGQRGLFDAEELREFRHASRAEREDADELRLDGRQVVAL